jgi:serine/threonine-protein kinase RsbT
MMLDYRTTSSLHLARLPGVFLPVAFHRTIGRVLLDYLSARGTQAVLAAVESATRTRAERLTPDHVPCLVVEAEKALDLSPVDQARRTACLRRLRKLGARSASEAFARRGLDAERLVRVEQEVDIVRARLVAGDACRELAFSEMKCTNVMTAVSELARNIFHYAGAGQIAIRRFDGDRSCVEVMASDHGPGIADVERVLSDSHRSSRGAGAGLKAIRRLMDSFQIESSPGVGTRVAVWKFKG